MITTVTLNPMLDKTVYVDALEHGRIHRPSSLEMVAGGKGIDQDFVLADAMTREGLTYREPDGIRGCNDRGHSLWVPKRLEI